MAVTGYLYAVAGATATLFNAGGTRMALRRFGLGAAYSGYPLGIALCSVYILAHKAGLMSIAAARAFDLAARWSFCNTFKSVIWIVRGGAASVEP